MQPIHKPAETISDKIAWSLVKFFRFFADTFFQKRYGNRAIVLETVAVVLGMALSQKFFKPQDIVVKFHLFI